MRAAHYHLHTSYIARSKRSGSGSAFSSVAAAAYQSNERLVAEQSFQFSLEMPINKEKAQEAERHTSQQAHQEPQDKLIDFRKELNQGIVSDTLRKALDKKGLTLSDAAVAEKQDRRNWTIHDGDQSFQLKSYTKRETDKETGKRKRVGEYLDVHADTTHDYRTKEDVVQTWIAVPDQAPDWMRDIAGTGAGVEAGDRQRMWNAVEHADTSREARPARKFEVSLSRELSYEANKAAVEEFVDKAFTQRGYVADMAIHSVIGSDGLPNVHAHILVANRPLDEAGNFAKTKSYQERWTSKEQVVEWRKEWANSMNSALEKANSTARVDHRSYKERGINKTPQAKQGPGINQLEKRGVETKIGNHNRQVKHRNALLAFIPPRRQRQSKQAKLGWGLEVSRQGVRVTRQRMKNKQGPERQKPRNHDVVGEMREMNKGLFHRVSYKQLDYSFDPDMEAPDDKQLHTNVVRAFVNDAQQFSGTIEQIQRIKNMAAHAVEYTLESATKVGTTIFDRFAPKGQGLADQEQGLDRERDHER